ncbi:MAG: hypothetical protein KDC34_04690 [Saprospiraceae bacterium]|nr:hypothetical protein [Saprospiraceae bacterium]
MKFLGSILAFFIFFSGAALLHAQEIVPLKLKSEKKIVRSFMIPGKGLFFEIGKFKGLASYSFDNEMWHFSESGDLVWSVPLPDAQVAKKAIDFFVGSPLSDFFYHVEAQTKKTADGKKHFYIHQVNEGALKTLEVELVDDLEDWFVTQSGLHGVRYDDDKKGVFTLFSWSHSNMSPTEKEIDLPDDKGFTKWWFNGFNKDELCFIRKSDLSGNPQKSHKSTQMEIAFISMNGEIQRINKHTIALGSDKYLLPHNDRSYSAGTVISHTGIKESGSATILETNQNFTFEMFGNIWVNENGDYYVYGLYDNQDGEIAVDGLYVSHFSSDGSLMEAELYPLPNVLDHKHKMMFAQPQFTNVRFSSAPGRGFVLEFFDNVHFYTFDILDDLTLSERSAVSEIVLSIGLIGKDWVGTSSFAPDQESFLEASEERARSDNKLNAFRVTRYFGSADSYVLLASCADFNELGFFGFD